MNTKHTRSSSSPPPHKTKSTALNNAVNRAGSWIPCAHWLTYQIQNTWKWTEIKLVDSRLHKPALNHWLFVLEQHLKEVCSEQQDKTIPDLILQQVLFARLKGIAQFSPVYQTEPAPTEIWIFFFFMSLTVCLQFFRASGDENKKPLH